MRYEDYVDMSYKPAKTDLVCDFYVEPTHDTTIERAIGAVAAESSIGTWTELSTTKPYMEYLAARVFSQEPSGEGYRIKVAYPIDNFEYHNMPQILSSVAGNIYGMKEVDNLRLEDITFPEKIVKAYAGPKFGIEGVRKVIGVKKRPLVGTIVKPKLGLNYKDHAKVAYDAWVGGCDVVKDDENLSSQRFNPFDKRIIATLKLRDKAERETGEKKMYMANITAETNEMIRRAKFIKKQGGEYAMIDVLTLGWSAVETVRDADLNLVLHAHRAMHAALTRNKRHGMSMLAIGRIARLCGVDQLHIGAAVGKMEGGASETQPIQRAITEPWYKIKPVFPVASGGLNPLKIPDVYKIFGNDVIIQLGGGIHGNPLGTRAGAKAARDAVDAVMHWRPLKGQSKELDAAIEKWGKN